MPHKRFLQKIAVALMTFVLSLSSMPIASATEITLQNVQVMSAPLSVDSTVMDGMVRVLLSSLGTTSTLHLTIVGNYSVNGDTSRTLSSGSTATVSFSSSTGAITLTSNGTKTNMGQYFVLRRHSASGTNGIKIAETKESNNPYPGDLSFRAIPSGSGYKLYTIAHVYIEDYLYGVLPYEMGNSTGIEALKAQAVAARTYTVRMMQSRQNGYYDVVNTTNDQVYLGTPSGNANCVAAVNATKGIVLQYGSSYITTYYSASNGGQTEAYKNLYPNASGYGYLVVKDDPFDYANTSSVVKKATVYADLTSSSNNQSLMSLLLSKAVTKLKSSGYAATTSNTSLRTLTSVTPHTPKYASPSRLYTKMDFTMTANVGGSTATVTVTCDIFSELESLLGMSIQTSKNELWSVVKSSSSFSLQARRYGHGFGMSQRGAMQMAKLGYTYDQILGFYYDGCTRVQRSFTNTILSETGDTETTIEDPADMEDDSSTTCRGTVQLLGTGASLAIRAGKSTSDKLIGTASNGAIMSVIANDGSWCYVEYGALKGYVPTSSLTITGTPTGLDGAASSISGFATVTASDYVNLRASGSMSAKVLTTAPNGAIMTVFSQSGSWAHVQYAATEAYVNTGYVSISSSYPSSAITSGGSSVAMVTSADGGSVNLRASASTTASVLATLANGTLLTVRSDDGSWCAVTYGSINGYVLRELLTYTDEELPSDGSEVPTEPDDPTDDPIDENAQTAIVTTESGSLNLRAEASAGSRVLTTIPKGATVEVLSTGSTWCGVRYNGYVGYAMTMYLTITGEATQTPEVEGESTAVVTTVSGSLNLRIQPRAGSQILRTIPQYATVTVYEWGTEWCHVSYAGVDGYAMTVFLTPSSTAEQPEETPLPEETEPPETEDGDDEPIIPDTTDEDTLYAVVTTVSGSLNLRREPITGSEVLTRIPKGATIVIAQRMSAWSKTTYAGQEGYVMNSYLTFREGAPEVTTGVPATVTTASGSLNLRTEPSQQAGVIARIPQYAAITVYDHGNTWCYVGYGGQMGYVMTYYLTFVDTGSTNEDDSTTSEGENGTTSPDEETSEDGGTTNGSSSTTAYVVTASGSLNLREYADTTARVLTTIPQNAAVTVTSRNATWCGVNYGGFHGYAMTQFLAFAENVILPEETITPDEPVTETTETTVWVVTASGSLNLREAAGSDARVLITIPQYASATLLSQSGTWSRVRYAGITGYAMSQFLSTTEPFSSTAGGTSATQAPSATTPPTTSPIIVNDLDVTLHVPDVALFATASPTDGSGVVALWELCKESGEPLVYVPSGEELEVILIGDLWCRVAYQNTQGYCLLESLKLEAY